MEPIPVSIHADDPISRAGVASELRPRPEVRVLEAAQADQAKVSLVVSDAVTEQTLRTLGSATRIGAVRLVLVVTRIDDSDLVSVVEHGVVGLVRWKEATPERLVTVVRSAAAGEGAVPPDLLGRLLAQVGRVQRQVPGPRGLGSNGLTDREAAVLRLVADGFDTAEIATKVAYSERTVKQTLHDIQ
ncbi:LuxR C-terminal-related transcriptional regulator [Streptomyces decoyicus]